MKNDDELDNELDIYSDEISHYGTPRHSGRYPWGSGEDPYQHTSFGGSKVRHPGKGKAKSVDTSHVTNPAVPGTKEEKKKAFDEWTKQYNPYDRSKAFHMLYNELHRQGITDKEMSEAWGISINDIKAKRAISSQNEKTQQILQAMRLSKQGFGPTEIAQKMGLPKSKESTVRGWLKSGEDDSKPSYLKTAEALEKQLKEGGGFLDISKGVELELGITDNHLKIATAILKEKGYAVQKVGIAQVTNPGQYTSTIVLAPKGTTGKEIIKNISKIKSVVKYEPDDAVTATEFPRAIDRSKVHVVWDEDGGSKKDGLVEIRPGAEGLDLGNAAYAQVRILVKNCNSENSTRYIKGMAVVNEDAFKGLPDDVDIIVNSNKSIKKGDDGAFKDLKSETDVDKVFGAKIKANGQYHYIDENGEEQLGFVNKVNEEGDWEKWSKTLPSQFLSKQPVELIKKQLDITYADKLEQYEEIKSLTNPVVRQKMLEEFASGCDTDAVTLAAASLPRQQSHVLIPIPSLKENEVYAPNYKTGEEVVLVRFPHEGIFQIPRLKVNNNVKDAIDIIGTTAVDAIGINNHTAQILSGADFDGDTVLVIPVNSRVKVKNKEPYKELQDFNPDKDFPKRPGMKVLTKDQQQTQMGVVSNLITDMTIHDAPDEDIIKATKHAMVTIDCIKHEYDWERSYVENDIDNLKRKYQMHADGKGYGGASTLLSRSTSEARVEEQQAVYYDEDGKMHKSYKPNAETGEWETAPTGRKISKLITKTVVDPETGKKTKVPVLDENGNKQYKEQLVLTKTTKMALEKDAHNLSSGTIKEELYADYANNMKALANRCRKDSLAIEMPKKSIAAEREYSAEIESLNSKLEEALKNAPRERQAQVIANATMREIFADNPGLEKDEIKKYAQTAIQKARSKVGANKKRVSVTITEREWQAIQNNAISPSKLRAIIDNTDSDRLKKLCLPKRDANTLTTAQQNRLKAMIASGQYTNQEIAERMGVSTSTIYKYKY